MNAFSTFTQCRRIALRRIAARTCGEFTVEDVVGEAWLIARKIGEQRGQPVDFDSVADQETVLAWLFNHLVRYTEKQSRHAVRLDKDWGREDDGVTMAALSRFLVAPEEFDPAVALQLFQESGDFLLLVRHSYSQAAAYAILLERFDWEMADLAGHLHVETRTLKARIHYSAAWIRHQPSLFDRIHSMEIDFVPLQKHRKKPRAVEVVNQVQMGWA